MAQPCPLRPCLPQPCFLPRPCPNFALAKYQIADVFTILSLNDTFLAGMWVGPYEGKVVSLEDIKKIKDTSLVWEVINGELFLIFLDKTNIVAQIFHD